MPARVEPQEELVTPEVLGSRQDHLRVELTRRWQAAAAAGAAERYLSALA
ncbi:MAG: hypothetical protein PVS3B2_10530 [Candidatus Dormibacteraceae bacterium]